MNKLPIKLEVELAADPYQTSHIVLDGVDISHATYRIEISAGVTELTEVVLYMKRVQLIGAITGRVYQEPAE